MLFLPVREILFGKILGANLWTKKQVVSFLYHYLTGTLPNSFEYVVHGLLKATWQNLRSSWPAGVKIGPSWTSFRGPQIRLTNLAQRLPGFFALGSAAPLRSCSLPSVYFSPARSQPGLVNKKAEQRRCSDVVWG